MDPEAPRPGQRRVPLLDNLGRMCQSGRDSASYLWQVPDDEAVRRDLGALLKQIREESGAQGRREMGRITQELETALAASPSPQQVEILQDGFDRLFKLWQAAKSGLL
jgi:hypothetical protein